MRTGSGGSGNMSRSFIRSRTRSRPREKPTAETYLFLNMPTRLSYRPSPPNEPLKSLDTASKIAPVYIAEAAGEWQRKSNMGTGRGISQHSKESFKVVSIVCASACQVPSSLRRQVIPSRARGRVYRRGAATGTGPVESVRVGEPPGLGSPRRLNMSRTR